MTRILYRLATSADATRVAEVLERPLEDCRSLIARWTAAEAIWLAEDGGALLGLAVTESSFFGNEFVELVRVVPAARRRGVASALLRTVSDRRRSPKLFTSTNLSNTPMQGVLARLGWASAGIVYGLDEGDPELFFQAPPR